MRSYTVLYLKVITIVTVLGFVTRAFVTNLNRETDMSGGLTNIERYWVEAETKEGFIEVRKILGDPKTTNTPLGIGE